MYRNHFINAMKAKQAELENRKKRKFVSIEEIEEEAKAEENAWREEMKEFLRKKKKIEIPTRDNK